MRRAIVLAGAVRATTSPNPWVGCVVVPEDSLDPLDPAGWFEGATSPPGGPHAEVTALTAAGPRARSSTLYTTLEPCAHHGRTGPCADAIIESGVSRVVVGVADPDNSVAGRGVDLLREAGIEVTVGIAASEVEEQLAAYLTHRRTGRPFVILKLAATMDGRIAAPDGSSRWITGPEARDDAHELRRMSDAVLVGAATVRSDDPELTVRTEPPASRQPLRVVLGKAPAGSGLFFQLWSCLASRRKCSTNWVERVYCNCWSKAGPGWLPNSTAAEVVDRYVLYFAPALFGGDDAIPLFAGTGAANMDQLWRGRVISVELLGQDVRIELAPKRHESSQRAA